MLAPAFVLSLVVLASAQTTPQAPAPDPYQAAMGKLKSQEPLLRRQGVEELAALRHPMTVSHLTEALQDPHVFVRSAAIDQLGVLRAPVAGRLLPLLDSAREKEAAVRRSAATALAYLADPVSADALVAALKDQDSGVRYSAVRALGALRVPQSTGALVGFLSDSDVGMRRTVAAALGQIRDPASAGLFLKVLKDSDVYVRLEAVKALAVMAGPEAMGGLRAALLDADLPVALQAAMALSSQGSHEGVVVALKALKQDKPFLRQQAAGLLGVAGDASAAAPLEAALKAEKDAVTKAMLEAALKQVKSRLGTAKPAAAPKPKAAPTKKPAAGKP